MFGDAITDAARYGDYFSVETYLSVETDFSVESEVPIPVETNFSVETKVPTLNDIGHGGAQAST